MRLMQIFIICLVMIIPVQFSFAEQAINHHGMSVLKLEKSLQKYMSHGYRVRYIDAYNVNNKVYFATIWEKSSEPDNIIQHSLTKKGYHQETEKLRKQGYQLKLLDGYKSGGDVRYVAIWKKGSNTDLSVRPDMSSEEFLKLNKKQKDRGFQLTHISGYGTDKPRYAAIWQKKSGPDQILHIDLSFEAYTKKIKELTKKGYLPILVSGFSKNGQDRYAAVWEKLDQKNWVVRHRLSSINYQSALDNQHYTGFRLKSVTGYAVGKRPFYTAIWQGGGFKPTDRKHIDKTVQVFMKKYNMPGLTIAITRKGRLVFAKGYGMSRRKPEWHASPLHRFRIASVSKSLTSIAIMKLIENGVMKLDDKVFGEGSILGKSKGPKRYSEEIKKITVKHLLQHTAGGDEWNNKGSDGTRDPVFSNPDLEKEKLISWVLSNQSTKTSPGEKYSYSNFGYLILGRIIEKKSGLSYEKYIRKHILRPAGVRKMLIAREDKRKRRKEEVVYYGSGGEDPYTLNMRRMDAHAGWIGSSVDLVRLMVRVDGFASKKDILTADMIKTMTTGSTVNQQYASGWAISKNDDWWHSGSLPGSYATLVRTKGEYCWAVLANMRNLDKNFSKDFDQLTRTIISGVKTWPDYDLF